MESIKNKLGILALVLCILIIIAAIWYCLFGWSGNSDKNMEGTLVQGRLTQEEVIVL